MLLYLPQCLLEHEAEDSLGLSERRKDELTLDVVDQVESVRLIPAKRLEIVCLLCRAAQIQNSLARVVSTAQTSPPGLRTRWSSPMARSFASGGQKVPIPRMPKTRPIDASGSGTARTSACRNLSQGFRARTKALINLPPEAANRP